MAQDHKRAYDGDKGPNTGGMGAYSPVPFVTEEIESVALEQIMKPTAAAMVAEGVPFCGVLYGGLILTEQGPKVIEFNARFGDPETEVVLPRLKSDIYELFDAAIEGRDHQTEWSDDAYLGVVMASTGYPASSTKGAVIGGLERAESHIYHMGTAIKDGNLVTAGGRVLMVVGKGATLAEAHSMAMADVAKVECKELFYRSDIGHKVLN
jgi:phosphoribosylamine--glycine ligase